MNRSSLLTAALALVLLAGCSGAGSDATPGASPSPTTTAAAAVTAAPTTAPAVAATPTASPARAKTPEQACREATRRQLEAATDTGDDLPRECDGLPARVKVRILTDELEAGMKELEELQEAEGRAGS